MVASQKYRLIATILNVCLVMPEFAHSQDYPPPNCPHTKIRTISVDVISEYAPKSESEGAAKYANLTKLGDHLVKLSFRGPILGSMNSKIISLNSKCVGNSVEISAQLSQSKDYVGASKNALWRPRINVAVTAYQPGNRVYVIWTMQSSNGDEIRNTQILPFSNQIYPFVSDGLLN